MKYIEENIILDSPGVLGKTNEVIKTTDKEYSQDLYEAISKHNLLPENLDGFIFLSASASISAKEIGLAKIIDQKLQHTKLNKKPLFIASDFFGEHDQAGNFKPGFDVKGLPNLDNVSFSFLSADARKLSLKDHSVDLIMDQMGAIWQIISSYLVLENEVFKIPENKKNEIKEKVKNIFQHYSSKLKDNGHIIIDAPNDINITTVELLSMAFGKDLNEELKKIGLNSRLIEDNNEKLLALYRTSEPNNK